MTKALHVAALAMLLAACGSRANPGATNPLILPPAYGTPAAPASTTASDGTCRNVSLDRFNGRIGNAATGAEMLRLSGARTIRWVQPGQMVTMDYNPQRLTVHLATGFVIQRASCG